MSKGWPRNSARPALSRAAVNSGPLPPGGRLARRDRQLRLGLLRLGLLGLVLLQRLGDRVGLGLLGLLFVLHLGLGRLGLRRRRRLARGRHFLLLDHLGLRILDRLLLA